LEGALQIKKDPFSNLLVLITHDGKVEQSEGAGSKRRSGRGKGKKGWR
jgi:hypothetical protein